MPLFDVNHVNGPVGHRGHCSHSIMDSSIFVLPLSLSRSIAPGTDPIV